jgi:hypothetical protein
MPVNELVIAVVLQEVNAMLEDNGGNQAVHGIPDGVAFAPQSAVNGGAQFKRAPGRFQIKEVVKLLFGGEVLLLVANALQDFGENKAADAEIVAISDVLGELFRLDGFVPTEEINPDR